MHFDSPFLGLSDIGDTSCHPDRGLAGMGSLGRSSNFKNSNHNKTGKKTMKLQNTDRSNQNINILNVKKDGRDSTINSKNENRLSDSQKLGRTKLSSKLVSRKN